MDNLKPPATYQGAKTRISKKIVDIILNDINNNSFDFYDLCCGSGAITLELYNQTGESHNMTMLDWSPWGDFWKSIGEGWFSFEIFRSIINNIPEDKRDVKAYLENLSKEAPDIFHIYKFLLLQAGSFGGKAIWIDNGKWQNCSFRNYWQPTPTSNRRSPVNPMMPMPEEIYKRVFDISANLSFVINGKCQKIETFDKIKKDSIVYIDPPYSNSTAYGSDFDLIHEIRRIQNYYPKKIYVSYGKQISKNAIFISEKRSKGNISGNNSAGVQEWLNII